MGEEPDGRLGGGGEGGEEEQEEGREEEDGWPPGEQGAKDVDQQHPQANHQGKQGEEGTSPRGGCVLGRCRWRDGMGWSTWATSMEQLAVLTEEETPANTRPNVRSSRLGTPNINCKLSAACL